MRFLFCYFALFLLAQLICLAIVDYPRKRAPVPRWADVINLVMLAAISAWLYGLAFPA